MLTQQTHASDQRGAGAEQLDLVRAAAERGVAHAQLLFGQMLLDGTGVERNPQAALYWFERAALGGELMAVNMVGRCLDQGWGVAPSQSLALQWFRRAAARGLDWGMYNLATLLLLGKDGVPVDREEALLWLCRAVELGHVKSKNLLAGFYEDGWVVSQDRARARSLYREAAVGGDFRGQFNYARFLLEEGDWLGALHWLRQVPQTATPAFLAKVRDYLVTRESPAPLLDFMSSLETSP